MAKKISSATIKEIIKANNKEDKKIILKTADAEIEVVIKPYISYQERTQMVNDIASIIFIKYNSWLVCISEYTSNPC